MLQSMREIKILVIADDEDFHLLIKSYLEDCGIFSLAATDVVQASGTAVREQPNLILLDIDLPEGGGLLFLDRLRANPRTPKIPVIVVATQITPGLESKARAQSVEACLQKPIKKEVLIDSLRQVLGRPPTQ